MAIRYFTNVPSTAQSDPRYQMYTGGDVPGLPGQSGVYDPRNAVENYYATQDYSRQLPTPIFDIQSGRTVTASNRPGGGTDLQAGGGTNFAGLGIQPSANVGAGSNEERLAAARAWREKAYNLGGGGGTTYKSPTGAVTTQKTVYEGEMPEIELSKMDKRRVKALRQKALAPRLRLLRTALNRALTQSYENPNVRRMIVSGALLSYGQGVETAAAGAEQFALQEEAAERATQNQEAILKYNAALKKYFQSGKVITEQKNLYGGEGGGTSAGVIQTAGRATLSGIAGRSTYGGVNLQNRSATV